MVEVCEATPNLSGCRCPTGNVFAFNKNGKFLDEL